MSIYSIRVLSCFMYFNYYYYDFNDTKKIIIIIIIISLHNTIKFNTQEGEHGHI